ncbi:MAG TPA: adenylate/guanylate cyclase domain-containing protein [Vitreimonas sp.]|nr:adenylate/guanylate cyclase domain-containing protein [Vitreimonas sp.]
MTPVTRRAILTHMAQRKLAAILSADVAGFSRQMEQDEAGALARLKHLFAEVFEPRVAEHGGRVVKFMGDGALVEFASVVAAVRCAMEVQEELANDAIQMRIGVNVGDVLAEADDIFGDGVNVAVRLQALAAPGGIAISRAVREQIAGKLDAPFEDMGAQQVKNIERPVHVFALGGANLQAANAACAPDDRISICVLPFDNLSGDPEQQYFSDGVTEDIITDLSKVSALSIASRTSAAALKGRRLSATEVSQRTRCTYVLEGSVRKAGNRVRITAQLIDGRSDSHVWAERYDRDLGDIFALQTEIAEAIAAALKARVLPAEKKALEAKATTSGEAYKLFLMARQYHVMGSERTDEIVVRLCKRAVELDPNYARAWALMATVQTKMHYRAACEDTGEEAAKRAIELDPQLAEAHAAYARVLANQRRYEEAAAAHETALSLDPDSYDANSLAGRTYTVMHRHEDAIRCFGKAAALVESDYVAAAMAIQNYEAIGDSEGAERAARRALQRIERIVAAEPDHGTALGHGVGILAILGEADRAKDWAERAMLLDPDNRTLRYNLACAMVKLREYDRALDYLESAMKQSHRQALDWAKADTDLDPLRELPRYHAIMAKTEARVSNEES